MKDIQGVFVVDAGSMEISIFVGEHHGVWDVESCDRPATDLHCCHPEADPGECQWIIGMGRYGLVIIRHGGGGVNCARREVEQHAIRSGQ